jgi:hypothetical protein
VTQPTRAGTGIVIVLLGAPAYLIWRKKTDRKHSQRGKIAPNTFTR